MSSFMVLFCGEKSCVVGSVYFFIFFDELVNFFHLSVRCFGLIFLGLCHHLWCYFVVKNGVLAVAMATATTVTVAVASGCDCCLL